MSEITIEGNKYHVPYRAEILKRKLPQTENLNQFLKYVLPSENYKQGKIPETTLLAAMIDSSEYSAEPMKWASILTSKVYGLQLFPLEIASKLTKLPHEIPWEKIDDKFERKVINEVDLKQLFGLLAKEDTIGAQSEIQTSIANVLSVLLSDEYEKQTIHRIIVNVLLKLSNEQHKRIRSIISGIFDQKAFGDTPTTENSTAFLNLVTKITKEPDELVRILIESIINDDEFIEPSDKMLFVDMVVNYSEEERQLLKEYFGRRLAGRTDREIAKDYIAHFFSQVGRQIGGNIVRNLKQRSAAAKVSGVL